jgi:hypothetical protein
VFRIALALCIATVGACASSGGPTPANEGTVDLVFRNETTSDVTLHVQWRRDGRIESERIRLGRLAGGATETFTVPCRGDIVTLSLDVPPSPPPSAIGPGTSPGRRLLDEASRGGSTGPVSSVLVEPGESLGWAIIDISPPSVRFWRIE